MNDIVICPHCGESTGKSYLDFLSLQLLSLVPTNIEGRHIEEYVCKNCCKPFDVVAEIKVETHTERITKDGWCERSNTKSKE